MPFSKAWWCLLLSLMTAGLHTEYRSQIGGAVQVFLREGDRGESINSKGKGLRTGMNQSVNMKHSSCRKTRLP